MQIDPKELQHITPDLRSLAKPVTMFMVDPMNARTGHDVDALAASLSEHGQMTPIVANLSKDGETAVILKGNGTFTAAVSRLNWKHIAAVIINDETSKAAAYAIADNATGDRSYFDDKTLALITRDLHRESGRLPAGITDEHYQRLIREHIQPTQQTAVNPKPGETAVSSSETLEERLTRLIDKWGVEPGQFIKLGKHRFYIADCTNPDNVARLRDGYDVDLAAADPPYCSGGFQEAGKAAGSVGTRGNQRIRRDSLSTRGYVNLMKTAVSINPAPVIYLFTDWRMWSTLYDTVEGAGYRVRQMIVWDKGSPGMGVGWRNQHELILCAIRDNSPFTKGVAVGNVLAHGRTGNKWYATEKPVALIQKLFEPNKRARIVVDMFAGAGGTLLAAQLDGRIALLMDEAPEAAAVTIERWHIMTGGQPEFIN